MKWNSAPLKLCHSNHLLARYVDSVTVVRLVDNLRFNYSLENRMNRNLATMLAAEDNKNLSRVITSRGQLVDRKTGFTKKILRL